MTLSQSQHDTINRFLQEQDMPALYRSYTWKGDTWEKGSPDLFRLEVLSSQAAEAYSLSDNHVMEIAKWRGPSEYQNDLLSESDTDNPLYRQQIRLLAGERA